MHQAITAPELRVEGVGLTYASRTGPVTALADCNLAIEGGRFGCLVGPSGCGKSTLLDIVAGLAPLQQGRVTIGAGGAPGKGAGAAPGRVAVVFQRPALFPWKTVLANITFGLEAQRVTAAEARARAQAMIALVGLEGFAGAYPHELSGGMAQRVGIARALVLQPELLLMDEPFAAVDAQTRVVLQRELLRIVGSSAMTVLFVTHDVSEAVYLGDVVFVMSGRPGRVVRTIPLDRETRDRGSAGFARVTADIFDMLAPAARTSVLGETP